MLVFADSWARQCSDQEFQSERLTARVAQPQESLEGRHVLGRYRQQLRKLAVEVPGARQAVRAARQWRRVRRDRQGWRRFIGSGYGGYWGVFASFEEAARFAPATKPLGYDHPELAAEYQVMLEEQRWEYGNGLIRTFDYPVMFWLSVLLREPVRTVFDFGGNVGVHFYGYSECVEFPRELRWTICDVAAIVQAGERIAEERKAALDFTTTFDDAAGQDLFLAGGSVQYVEDLGRLLRSLRRLPNHVLVNRLPLYDGPRFVTLQNGGPVFYPQYVFNRDEFIASIGAAGYELVDSWDNMAPAVVPFHAKSFQHQGLYFRLTDGDAANGAASSERSSIGTVS
jgi:putative methyltransferase (TIGR04325 family)